MNPRTQPDITQHVPGTGPAGCRPSARSPCHGAAIALVLMLGAAGCAVVGAPDESEKRAMLERMPEVRHDLFDPPAPVPEFERLLDLTESQKREFRRYFHAETNRGARPYRRVYNFLAERLADVRFREDTIPAAEAVATRSANCMSLALVTTAYARLARVQIGWQLADADPIYSQEGAVIYSANHIQTRLYDVEYAPTLSILSFGRPYILVDYFADDLPPDGTPLREHQVIALVYQNLGVEALAEGRYSDSLAFLVHALQSDPFNPNLYNALGVLHRRVGADVTAEALYRFALEEFGDSLLVLRNYRKLLRAGQRFNEARRLQARILALPDPDPFPLLELGDEAASEGRLQDALAYYRKAAEVAPYLHQIHGRIARVFSELGDVDGAERALIAARDKAWIDNEKQRYQAKLEALRGYR